MERTAEPLLFDPFLGIPRPALSTPRHKPPRESSAQESRSVCLTRSLANFARSLLSLWKRRVLVQPQANKPFLITNYEPPPLPFFPFPPSRTYHNQDNSQLPRINIECPPPFPDETVPFYRAPRDSSAFPRFPPSFPPTSDLGKRRTKWIKCIRDGGTTSPSSLPPYARRFPSQQSPDSPKND